VVVFELNMNTSQRIKIIFYAYSTIVLKQYYEHLNNKADCWWLVSNPHVYDELERNGYKKILFKKFFSMPKFIVIFLNKLLAKLKLIYKIQKIIFDKIKPDICLTDTSLQLIKFNLSAIKILVFHSVPYKRYFLMFENFKYDLMLLPSEYHKKKLKQCFNIKDDNKLKVVGWPGSDVFINKKVNARVTSEFIKKVGLSPVLKTVMYAPTYNAYYKRGLFPLSFGKPEDALEIFCKSCSELNVNLIVKLHPNMSTFIRNKKLQNIVKRHNGYWANKVDKNCIEEETENFLWVTDVLVSDISGIITSFMILDKPIVYIEPDNEHFNWKDADLPKEFRAGRIVTSMQELIDSIRKSLDSPDENKIKRQEVLKEIFYKLDGNSSERAAQTILEYYMDFKLKKGIDIGAK